jgi:hypothetical protein
VLVAEHRRSGTFALQMKGKGSRRVASVESDYVIVAKNLLTKDLKAAHATRMRFYQDMKLNVTAERAQVAEHNGHELNVASKRLGAH